MDVINGQTIESEDSTHLGKLEMGIQDPKDRISMIITKLGHYPIVLVVWWLRLYDMALWFAYNMVTFRLQCCTTHCHVTSVTVWSVREEPPKPVYEERTLGTADIWKPKPCGENIVILNRASCLWTVKQKKLIIYKASSYDINKAIEANDLTEKPLEEVIWMQYHEFIRLVNQV